MDAVLLARLQFALTVGFHFLFPPITLGLSLIILALETIYLRGGSEFYKAVSSFWIKILGVVLPLAWPPVSPWSSPLAPTGHSIREWWATSSARRLPRRVS